MSGQTVDVTGVRYGHLLAIRRMESRRTTPRWLFRCDCGYEKEMFLWPIRAGKVHTCGTCGIGGKGTRGGQRGKSLHGASNKVLKGTTYCSWKNMRERCLNPRHHNFPRYGGRGITICSEWSEFAKFLADMGERPEGRTIDRIDVDGNYEPGNCRWATPKQQTDNRRVA